MGQCYAFRLRTVLNQFKHSVSQVIYARVRICYLDILTKIWWCNFHTEQRIGRNQYYKPFSHNCDECALLRTIYQLLYMVSLIQKTICRAETVLTGILERGILTVILLSFMYKQLFGLAQKLYIWAMHGVQRTQILRIEFDGYFVKYNTQQYKTGSRFSEQTSLTFLKLFIWNHLYSGYIYWTVRIKTTLAV